MIILIFLCFPIFLWGESSGELDFELWREQNDPIVLSSFQIELKDYPLAHNPSLIEFGSGYLLTFRQSSENCLSVSYIGIALLDASFKTVESPQILCTRLKESKVPSQSEDARIFSYRGRFFLIYNDNLDIVNPRFSDRRDMFLSELVYSHGHFSLSPPMKIISNEHYDETLWQKNWVPFEWNRNLLFGYTIDPHEVIYPNLREGICYLFHKTEPAIAWDFGFLRGGTPALLVDGEYWAFFHSGIMTASKASYFSELWHYFMGAYAFSASPPFQITKMTPYPICEEGFYTQSSRGKRVIFPGGFVVKGSEIYLAYGKDDCEIWIAVLDKEALKRALKPISQ